MVGALDVHAGCYIINPRPGMTGGKWRRVGYRLCTGYVTKGLAFAYLTDIRQRVSYPHYTFNNSSILAISRIYYSSGQNCVSNDQDHVNDEPTATAKSKKPPF